MSKKSNVKQSTMLHQLDPTVAEIVATCMAKRKHVKELEDEAAAIKEEVKETLSAVMPAYGLEKVENNDGDTISFTHVNRSTLDKDKLKLELVSRGVSTAVVSDAMAASTKVSSYDSVTYRPHKEE